MFVKASAAGMVVAAGVELAASSERSAAVISSSVFSTAVKASAAGTAATAGFGRTAGCKRVGRTAGFKRVGRTAGFKRVAAGCLRRTAGQAECEPIRHGSSVRRLEHTLETTWLRIMSDVCLMILAMRALYCTDRTLLRRC